MDDENIEFDYEPLAGRKLHPVDFVVTLFTAIATILQALVSVADDIAELFAMQANYDIQQDEIREQVHMELEALPTTDDSDER